MKNNITFRQGAVEVIHNGKEVTKFTGDETLIKIIKPLFQSEVTTMTAIVDKGKDVEEIIEKQIVLEPGDENYVMGVLLTRVQNELGMDVE